MHGIKFLNNNNKIAITNETQTAINVPIKPTTNRKIWNYYVNFLNKHRPYWYISKKKNLRYCTSPESIRYGEKEELTCIFENDIYEEYPFQKDLTRYGIESNPGPMHTINEQTPFEENRQGTYIRCYQCDKEYCVSISGKLIFFTTLCNLCLKTFESQSDIFTSDSYHDILGNLKNTYDWIYNGKYHGKSLLSHYLNIPDYLEKHISLLEDILMLIHNITISNNNFDRYIAVANFCKLRGNRIGMSTTLCYIISELFEQYQKESIKINESDIIKDLPFESQSHENVFSEFRYYLSFYEKLKNTQIYKKMYKFMLYVLSLGLLDKININFKSLEFDKFEAEAIKRTHKPGIDMLHCILDTIIFVCEKGYIFFQTGDLQTFFHSGSSYELWLSTAQRLIRESKYLSNPEPHNINRFKFHSELLDTIEKGKSIIKFTTDLDKFEKLNLQKILMDLQMIESNEVTKKSAQMPRKDPFAILLHGSSSIAKSQLTQILFYHYGKVFDLPIGDEYRYTRCPTDEYWSGFNSTQWCIVMDDIAFLKPNGEVDPTLKEMLQVKNSVPYTPPQAALEDKGRTPVKAELLIGTTNTKHLNLHAYFACPFAIARRLNYIITPHVKSEYAKNAFMADSTKIPVTPDGEYMDIWWFEIFVPIPEKDEEIDCQNTRYSHVHTFHNIHDMLEWYITVAKQHEISQQKALGAVNVMTKVEVCKECYRAVKFCKCYIEQTEELVSDLGLETKIRLFICSKLLNNYWNLELLYGLLYSFIEYVQKPYYLFLFYMIISYSLMYIPLTFLSLLFSSAFMIVLIPNFWYFISVYLNFYYGYMWKYKVVSKILPKNIDTLAFIYRSLGSKIKNQLDNSNKLKYLGLFLSSSAVILILRKLWNSYMKAQSLGNIPVPMDKEKPTFYYHDPYANTEVEISGQSKCAQGDILLNKLRFNTARFNFKFDDRNTINSTTAVNIKGNIWMFNKHAFKYNSGLLSVILENIEQNISRNIFDIRFNELDVKLLPNSDLAFIELRALPPGQNLVPYFPKDKPLKGDYKGKYIMISKLGEKHILELNHIRIGNCPVFGVPGYFAKAIKDTSKGDCGSICIGNIGNSQVLLGSHTAGNSSRDVFFQHISQSMIESITSQFEVQVDMGVIPISAPGYERTLVPIHTKSTLRWIPKGTATILGSFAGYRPKHKSKVTKTYINSFVKDEYEDKCGAPDMTWKPWHIALSDMVTPIHSFENSKLKLCEDAFYNDIVSLLGDKIKMLEVYTQDVALNGVAGVTFVDRLNISTSAGNPFKKSKKNFIHLDENNHITKLDDVIQERINMIEECYSKGMRFHAQFCGHLKDEPTPTKKIISGKTRVFTGGEFAWSVVVRRYLLSHIRLIQNNPFIFEAMPGIVAQSSEWNRLYEYLIQHGEDRIIAGDYGKFDKRMAAPFILSAFNILIRLAKEAGWNDNDLLILKCISFDTAFPNIDFNGDLIEIQGNPSGHPLTVIINCLVNSLYMRYAYSIISGKELDTFKRNVNLATYGDDNIMCVSQDCPNFTHTRISVAMKLIGVEYTMADKEAESIPYINIKDSSFLKRSFRYDSDIGTIVAPLEESSIHKMLTSYLDNGVLAPEAHSICVIETALREYFFYGKEKFLDRREYFIKLIERANLQDWVRDSTLPTYESLKQDFYTRSLDIEEYLC